MDIDKKRYPDIDAKRYPDIVFVGVKISFKPGIEFCEAQRQAVMLTLDLRRTVSFELYGEHYSVIYGDAVDACAKLVPRKTPPRKAPVPARRAMDPPTTAQDGMENPWAVSTDEEEEDDDEPFGPLAKPATPPASLNSSQPGSP